MHRPTVLTAALLTCLLLAAPVLAAKPEKQEAAQPPAQAAEKAPKVRMQPVPGAVVQDAAHQSQAFKRQQAYRQLREEHKARRDAAMKLREKNVRGNNPGNTGL